MRDAIRAVKDEQPFEINAAVILPDHMHFIWTLPPRDDRYSKRIGLMKVKFTQALKAEGMNVGILSASQTKHRESGLWQRRFWEHTIEDEDEFEAYFDYVHYNPVKHGYVACPHLWEASSFHRWMEQGIYEPHWGCCCAGRIPKKLDFSRIEDKTGEP